MAEQIVGSEAAVISAGSWPATTRPMGIGVILPIAEKSAFGGTPHFADILEMTRTANDVGFDAVWIIDHFVFRLEPDNQFAMPADPDDKGVWECFTTMAGLASATERIQIGALVAEARCIAIDFRGFGESTAAPPYTMDRFADDVVAVLDALSIERAVIVGLSMGGYVAFALWRRHRDRVRALVLADTRATADSEQGLEKRRETKGVGVEPFGRQKLGTDGQDRRPHPAMIFRPAGSPLLRFSTRCSGDPPRSSLPPFFSSLSASPSTSPGPPRSSARERPA